MLTELLALLQGQATWTQMGPVIIGFVLAIITGISLHEFMHAFTAYRLGDPTPKLQGRLTLNPSAHLDPIWTLLILVWGIGMGRPVQFQPQMLRMNPRLGSSLVAIAGPLANFFLALVFGLLLRVLDATLPFSPGISFGLDTLSVYVFLNLSLGFFNLIPIPPLDGFTVLLGLLPAELAYLLEPLRQYGFLILLLLFVAGGTIIGTLIGGPSNALFRLITGFSY